MQTHFQFLYLISCSMPLGILAWVALMVLTLYDPQECSSGKGLVVFRDTIPYEVLDQRLQMKKTMIFKTILSPRVNLRVDKASSLPKD